jgi:RecA-family ATPase
MNRTSSDSSVLRLHKAADLVAEPVAWTVDQIIPAGMLTVLSGKDKAGKTLLALEMVRSVIRGQPFLDQFTVQKGPVIFLALDDPASVTVDRIRQLELDDPTSLLCRYAPRLPTPTTCFLGRT